MKRIFSVFLSLLLFFALASDCFCASITIDGIPRNAEWIEVPLKMIINEGDESNCGVKSAFIKYIIDNDENAVYLYFNVTCAEITDDNQKCGISLRINDSAPITSTVQDIPDSPDTDLYSIESCTAVWNEKDFACEMRVGFKFGVAPETNLKIRFIDANGVKSNEYSYSLPNPEYTGTTVGVLGGINNGTASNTKTTKPTTQKTTLPPTTTRYSRPERTRRETTTIKASRKKSEKSTSIKVVTSVVKVIENKTAKVSETDKTTTTEASATAVMNANVIEPQTLSLTQNTKTSKRKQTALAIGSAVAFIALAVWALLPDKIKHKGDDEQQS